MIVLCRGSEGWELVKYCWLTLRILKLTHEKLGFRLSLVLLECMLNVVGSYRK